jgi:hypothetical protein
LIALLDEREVAPAGNDLEARTSDAVRQESREINRDRIQLAVHHQGRAGDHGQAAQRLVRNGRDELAWNRSNVTRIDPGPL